MLTKNIIDVKIAFADISAPILESSLQQTDAMIVLMMTTVREPKY